MAEYNGWYSYETWLVNLWWDGFFEEDAREICRSCDTKDEAISELSDRIKEMVEESTEVEEASFKADIINAALGNVDWREIADHYICDEWVEKTEE